MKICENSYFYCKRFCYFKFTFESRQNSHKKSQNYSTKVAKKFTVNEIVIIKSKQISFCSITCSERRSRPASYLLDCKPKMTSLVTLRGYIYKQINRRPQGRRDLFVKHLWRNFAAALTKPFQTFKLRTVAWGRPSLFFNTAGNLIKSLF